MRRPPKLKQISRTRGIEFFDLGPAFAKVSVGGRDVLFIPADGDWSPRGRRIVTDARFDPIRVALGGGRWKALPPDMRRRQ